MSDARQLILALDAAPEDVRRHGLRAAHPRPLASLGKRPGRPFSSARMSPQRAWRFPEVEYANAGSSIAALVLDCDRPERLEALADLPPYNWRIDRRSNGHAHVAWTLARPVHRYPAARIRPLRLLAHVADYYAATVGADSGYSGVLAHNPAPRMRQDEFRTIWWREKPHELTGLAEVIPFGWEPPELRQTGIGRNCDLFESGMRWAGRRENAHLPVLPALLALNQTFADPLPFHEVQATAGSIEKYRDRWAARGWHCPRWLEKKAAQGRAGGLKSRGGGRPRLYELGREPWTLAGVSRATWYRRSSR